MNIQALSVLYLYLSQQNRLLLRPNATEKQEDVALTIRRLMLSL